MTHSILSIKELKPSSYTYTYNTQYIYFVLYSRAIFTQSNFKYTYIIITVRTTKCVTYIVHYIYYVGIIST